jgi:hypothetical protein
VASFTTTVSESIRCFGVKPSNKWNEYNWNAFLWGEGTNQVLASETKLIAETASLADALAQVKVETAISESFSLGGSPSSETLRDGAGYYYVFSNNTTNGEERDPVSWTSTSVSTTSFMCQTAGSTTWS